MYPVTLKLANKDTPPKAYTRIASKVIYNIGIGDIRRYSCYNTVFLRVVYFTNSKFRIFVILLLRITGFRE